MRRTMLCAESQREPTNNADHYSQCDPDAKVAHHLGEQFHWFGAEYQHGNKVGRNLHKDLQRPISQVVLTRGVPPHLRSEHTRVCSGRDFPRRSRRRAAIELDQPSRMFQDRQRRFSSVAPGRGWTPRVHIRARSQRRESARRRDRRPYRGRGRARCRSIMLSLQRVNIDTRLW